MGGHTSKTHPNMSQEFRNKQIKRRERAQERELLTKAKELYLEIYGERAILYRNKLNTLKNTLKNDIYC